jgi:hypothetical protein
MAPVPEDRYESELFWRESELASRWRMSVRTLQRWRRAGSGPPWLKIGGRVVYDLADIRAFEGQVWNDGAERGSSR